MIKIATPVLGDEELKNLTACIETNWISSAGPFVSEFEQRIAEISGCDHGIATSSGTTALHLALAALGLMPEDEVLVPCLTFVATASTVRMIGAKPVLCDVDPVTWCIDPSTISSKITSKTKGIMAVHLYGHPCDMDSIRSIAREHDLWVFEDAAEALGATYKEQPVGGLGTVAIFSFFANKTITTGEGGMLVTCNSELAERARVLRDHGMTPDRRYWYDVVGFNYRMTNLQAAVGCAQLDKFNTFMSRKRMISDRYRTGLNDLEGIILPNEAQWAHHGYWMYTILVSDDAPITRDELAVALEEQNIESRRVFYPLHRLPPYEQPNRFPHSEFISDHGLSLPSGNGLSVEDQDFVITTIRERWHRD